MSDPVREFLSRSLLAAGGVVEESAEGLEALLPPAAASRLGCPEEMRIHLGAGDDEGKRADGALDGRLGSPLVERLVVARLEQAPMAAVALPAELPRSVPERLPVLRNAVRGPGEAERRRFPARFLALTVRLSLQGEELRTTLVPLAIRLEDGAAVAPFNLAGAWGVTAAPLDEGERQRAAEALRCWLRREGPGLVAGSIETLCRRARRDLEHMREYYASLDAEMSRAAERARSDAERARRLAKQAALPADLAARREQLRARMRSRLGARIVAATLVETEVDRFAIPVRRRRLDGTVTVLCRAADGSFEGPACAGCHVETLRFYLCDERLHPLCDSCGHSGRLDPPRCPACRPGRPAPLVVAVDDPTVSIRFGGL